MAELLLGNALKTLIRANTKSPVSEEYYQELIIDFFGGHIFWSELPEKCQEILNKWEAVFPNLQINYKSQKKKLKDSVAMAIAQAQGDDD